MILDCSKFPKSFSIRLDFLLAFSHPLQIQILFLAEFLLLLVVTLKAKGRD